VDSSVQELGTCWWSHWVHVGWQGMHHPCDVGRDMRGAGVGDVWWIRQCRSWERVGGLVGRVLDGKGHITIVT